MLAEMLYYHEEVCWQRDGQARPGFLPVTFSLIWESRPEMRDLELEADYWLWFDQGDLALIRALEGACPGVDWTKFVYFKQPNGSCIQVLDPWDDSTVATISVRRGVWRKATSGENVVDMAEWRRRRDGV